MSEGFSDLVPGIARLAEKALLVLCVIALLVVLAVIGWWWAFAGVLVATLLYGLIKCAEWFADHWEAG